MTKIVLFFKTTDLEDHYTLSERIVAAFLGVLGMVGWCFLYLVFMCVRGMELSGGLVLSIGLLKSIVYLVVGPMLDACKVPLVLLMLALSGSMECVEQLKSSFDELYYQLGLKY